VSNSKYDAEFKRDAVELLVHGGRPLKVLARELGVNPWTLRDWRDRHLREQNSSQGPPRGPAPAESAEEIRRLRAELEVVKRQRDILKKALGILSEQSPGSMP